jgi:hypothetical protein
VAASPRTKQNFLRQPSALVAPFVFQKPFTGMVRIYEGTSAKWIFDTEIEKLRAEIFFRAPLEGGT